MVTITLLCGAPVHTNVHSHVYPHAPDCEEGAAVCEEACRRAGQCGDSRLRAEIFFEPSIRFPASALMGINIPTELTWEDLGDVILLFTCAPRGPVGRRSNLCKQLLYGYPPPLHFRFVEAVATTTTGAAAAAEGE
jgi:hypothetical protein